MDTETLRRQQQLRSAALATIRQPQVHDALDRVEALRQRERMLGFDRGGELTHDVKFDAFARDWSAMMARDEAGR